MPADQPFEPNIGGSVSVVGVSTSGTPGTVTVNASTIGFAPSLMLTNIGPGVLLFARLDSKNLTTVSSLDVPIPLNTPRVFANPVPIGPTYISVTCTVTGCSVASTLYITPGEGGIF